MGSGPAWTAVLPDCLWADPLLHLAVFWERGGVVGATKLMIAVNRAEWAAFVNLGLTGQLYNM